MLGWLSVSRWGGSEPTAEAGASESGCMIDQASGSTSVTDGTHPVAQQSLFSGSPANDLGSDLPEPANIPRTATLAEAETVLDPTGPMCEESADDSFTGTLSTPVHTPLSSTPTGTQGRQITTSDQSRGEARLVDRRNGVTEETADELRFALQLPRSVFQNLLRKPSYQSESIDGSILYRDNDRPWSMTGTRSTGFQRHETSSSEESANELAADEALMSMERLRRQELEEVQTVLKQKIEELKADLMAIKHENDGLRESNAYLKKVEADCRAEVETERVRIKAEVEAEQNEMREMIHRIQKQFNDAQEEKSIVSAQLSEAEDALQDLRARLQESNALVSVWKDAAEKNEVNQREMKAVYEGKIAQLKLTAQQALEDKQREVNERLEAQREEHRIAEKELEENYKDKMFLCVVETERCALELFQTALHETLGKLVPERSLQASAVFPDVCGQKSVFFEYVQKLVNEVEQVFKPMTLKVKEADNLCHEYVAITAEKTALKMQVDGLEERVSYEVNSNKQLREDLRKTGEELEDTQCRLKEQSTLYATLIDEHRQCPDNLEVAVKFERSNASCAVEVLESEIVQLRHGNEKMQEKLKGFEASREAQLEKERALREQLKLETLERSNVVHALTVIEAEIRQLRPRIQELEEELKKAQTFREQQLQKETTLSKKLDAEARERSNAIHALTTAKSEIKELRVRIYELEKELKEAQKFREQQLEKETTLHQKLDAEVRERSNAVQALTAMESEIKELRPRIHELEKELKEAQKFREQQLEKETTLHQKLDAEARERSNAVEALTTMESEIKELRPRIHELEKELKEAQKFREQQLEKETTLNQKLDAEVRERSNAVQALTAIEFEIKELRPRIHELEKELKEAQRFREQQLEKETILHQSLDAEARERSNAVQALTAMESEIKELRPRNHELKEELKEAQKFREQQLEKETTLYQKLDTEVRERSNAVQALTAMETEIKELRPRIHELEKELKEAQKFREQQLEKETTLHQKLDAEARERSNAVQALTAMEFEIKELRPRIQELEKELKEAQKFREQQLEKETTLNQKLDAEARERSNAVQALTAMESEIKELRPRNHELEEELKEAQKFREQQLEKETTLNQKLDAEVRERSNAVQALTAMESEIKELRPRIHELEKELKEAQQFREQQLEKETTLHQKLDAEVRERSNAVQALTAMESEIKELRPRNHELEEELKEAQQFREQQLEKETTLHQKLDAEARERSNAVQALTAMECEIKELRPRIHELEEELKEAQQFREQQLEKETTLHQKLDAEVRERSNAVQALTAMESEIKELRPRYHELEEELKEAQKFREQQLEKETTLHQKLDAEARERSNAVQAFRAMESEIKELRPRIHELEEELKEGQKFREQQLEKETTLHQKLDAEVRERSNAVQALTAMESEIKELRPRNHELEEGLKEAQKLREQQLEKETTLHQKLDAEARERSNAVQALTAMESEIKELRPRIHELEEELKEAQKFREQQLEKETTLNQKLDAEVRERSNAVQALTAMQSEIKELRPRIHELEEELKEAQKFREQQLEKETTLHQKLDAEAREKSNAVQAFATMESEIKELRPRIKELEYKLEDTQRDYNAQMEKKRILGEQLEAQLIKVDEFRVILEENATEKTQLLSKVRHLHDELDAQIHRSTKEKQYHLQALEQVTSELAAARVECNRLEEAKEQTLASLSGALKARAEDIIKWTERQALVENDLEKGSEPLERYKAQSALPKDHFEQFSTEAVRCANELKEHKARILVLDQQLKQCVREKEFIQQQVEGLKNERDVLRSTALNAEQVLIQAEGKRGVERVRIETILEALHAADGDVEVLEQSYQCVWASLQLAQSGLGDVAHEYQDWKVVTSKAIAEKDELSQKNTDLQDTLVSLEQDTASRMEEMRLKIESLCADLEKAKAENECCQRQLNSHHETTEVLRAHYDTAMQDCRLERERVRHEREVAAQLYQLVRDTETAYQTLEDEKSQLLQELHSLQRKFEDTRFTEETFNNFERRHFRSFEDLTHATQNFEGFRRALDHVSMAREQLLGYSLRQNQANTYLWKENMALKQTLEAERKARTSVLVRLQQEKCEETSQLRDTFQTSESVLSTTQASPEERETAFSDTNDSLSALTSAVDPLKTTTTCQFREENRDVEAVVAHYNTASGGWKGVYVAKELLFAEELTQTEVSVAEKKATLCQMLEAIEYQCQVKAGALEDTQRICEALCGQIDELNTCVWAGTKTSEESVDERLQTLQLTFRVLEHASQKTYDGQKALLLKEKEYHRLQETLRAVCASKEALQLELWETRQRFRERLGGLEDRLRTVYEKNQKMQERLKGTKKQQSQAKCKWTARRAQLNGRIRRATQRSAKNVAQYLALSQEAQTVNRSTFEEHMAVLMSQKAYAEQELQTVQRILHVQQEAWEAHLVELSMKAQAIEEQLQVTEEEAIQVVELSRLCLKRAKDRSSKLEEQLVTTVKTYEERLVQLQRLYEDTTEDSRNQGAIKKDQMQDTCGPEMATTKKALKFQTEEGKKLSLQVVELMTALETENAKNFSSMTLARSIAHMTRQLDAGHLESVATVQRIFEVVAGPEGFLATLRQGIAALVQKVAMCKASEYQDLEKVQPMFKVQGGKQDFISLMSFSEISPSKEMSMKREAEADVTDGHPSDNVSKCLESCRSMMEAAAKGGEELLMGVSTLEKELTASLEDLCFLVKNACLRIGSENTEIYSKMAPIHAQEKQSTNSSLTSVGEADGPTVPALLRIPACFIPQYPNAIKNDVVSSNKGSACKIEAESRRRITVNQRKSASKASAGTKIPGSRRTLKPPMLTKGTQERGENASGESGSPSQRKNLHSGDSKHLRSETKTKDKYSLRLLSPVTLATVSSEAALPSLPDIQSKGGEELTTVGLLALAAQWYTEKDRQSQTRELSDLASFKLHAADYVELRNSFMRYYSDLEKGDLITFLMEAVSTAVALGAAIARAPQLFLQRDVSSSHSAIYSQKSIPSQKRGPPLYTTESFQSTRASSLDIAELRAECGSPLLVPTEGCDSTQNLGVAHSAPTSTDTDYTQQWSLTELPCYHDAYPEFYFQGLKCIRDRGLETLKSLHDTPMKDIIAPLLDGNVTSQIKSSFSRENSKSASGSLCKESSLEWTVERVMKLLEGLRLKQEEFDTGASVDEQTVFPLLACNRAMALSMARFMLRLCDRYAAERLRDLWQSAGHDKGDGPSSETLCSFSEQVKHIHATWKEKEQALKAAQDEVKKLLDDMAVIQGKADRAHMELEQFTYEHTLRLGTLQQQSESASQSHATQNSEVERWKNETEMARQALATTNDALEALTKRHLEEIEQLQQSFDDTLKNESSRYEKLQKNYQKLQSRLQKAYGKSADESAAFKTRLEASERLVADLTQTVSSQTEALRQQATQQEMLRCRAEDLEMQLGATSVKEWELNTRWHTRVTFLTFDNNTMASRHTAALQRIALLTQEKNTLEEYLKRNTEDNLSRLASLEEASVCARVDFVKQQTKLMAQLAALTAQSHFSKRQADIFEEELQQARISRDNTNNDYRKLKEQCDNLMRTIATLEAALSEANQLRRDNEMAYHAAKTEACFVLEEKLKAQESIIVALQSSLRSEKDETTKLCRERDTLEKMLCDKSTALEKAETVILVLEEEVRSAVKAAAKKAEEALQVNHSNALETLKGVFDIDRKNLTNQLLNMEGVIKGMKEFREKAERKIEALEKELEKERLRFQHGQGRSVDLDVHNKVVEDLRIVETRAETLQQQLDAARCQLTELQRTQAVDLDFHNKTVEDLQLAEIKAEQFQKELEAERLIFNRRLQDQFLKLECHNQVAEDLKCAKTRIKNLEKQLKADRGQLHQLEKDVTLEPDGRVRAPEDGHNTLELKHCTPRHPVTTHHKCILPQAQPLPRTAKPPWNVSCVQDPSLASRHCMVRCACITFLVKHTVAQPE